MKTIKIISALIVFLFFIGIPVIYAGDPPVLPDNLNKHIVADIVYPSDAKTENIQGFVLVDFIVGDDGYIKISGINASDEMLKKFVEEKLLSIRLCPYDLSVGKEFTMKFDFKLLKE
jgi:hypothetical protein